MEAAHAGHSRPTKGGGAMKEYIVRVIVSGKAVFTVEAKSEKEAQKKAMETDMDCYGDVDYYLDIDDFDGFCGEPSFED